MENASLKSSAEFASQYYDIGVMMFGLAILSGMILFIYGLYSIYKNAENPQRFTKAGAFKSILSGTLLLMPGAFYGMFRASFSSGSFSGNTRDVLAIDAAMNEAASSAANGGLAGYIPESAWTMVIGFMFLVGMYSFLTGLFMVKSIGSQDSAGQPVGFKKVINHLFWGMVCMNITWAGNIASSFFFNS